MKKNILYIAMSLDGYIAKSNNSVEFLSGDFSDPENMGSFESFNMTVDTVVLGYNTYHEIVTNLSKDVWPYEDKHTYVLTSRDIPNTNNITFINTDVKSLVDLINKNNNDETKSIWVCGGAYVVNQFLENDLLDEITISVIPTILGNGIKLFNNSDIEKKLKLKSTMSYNGIVDLTYIKR